VSQVRSRDGTTIAYDQLGEGQPVNGDKSIPVLREAAQALAKAIPGAQLRTLAGQTHNVAAAALAPVLKEFFAS